MIPDIVSEMFVPLEGPFRERIDAVFTEERGPTVASLELLVEVYVNRLIGL